MSPQTAFAAFIGLVALIPVPATADDGNDAGGDDTGFWVHQVEEGQHGHVPAVPDGGGGNAPATPPILLGDGACDSADQAAGELLSVTFCTGPEPLDVLTVGDIRNAFARLNLPAAKLVIQPPDGLTLVNFDTNFYTTSTEPVTRTVTLLGQRVTLEATPSEYQWTFGDGQSLASTKPGAAYPALTITHNYERKGTYRPSLDTVYSGRYRVGDGAWQQIPGTVTIDGTPQSLRAIEAQPKLVGY